MRSSGRLLAPYPSPCEVRGVTVPRRASRSGLVRIRDIRELLEQAGHAIQPSPHRLANLDDLYRLARSTGITIQPETKTAC